MKRKMARKEKEEAEENKETAPQLPAMLNQTYPQPDSNNDEPKLLMRVVTWLRDSHALFDYESRQIQKK